MGYGKGRRGPADGPHNSQGFEQDWIYFSAEMRASHEHKKHWDQLAQIRKYFEAHPMELANVREDWWRMPWVHKSELFERIFVWLESNKRELENRKRVLDNINKRSNPK